MLSNVKTHEPSKLAIEKLPKAFVWYLYGATYLKPASLRLHPPYNEHLSVNPREGAVKSIICYRHGYSTQKLSHSIVTLQL